MIKFLPPLYLGLSCLLIGCTVAATPGGSGSTASDCVAVILARDDSLGRVRNHACETSSLTTAIREYLTGLERLEYGPCPRAFTRAFAKHRRAWSRVLPITDRYPALRGEMHELFEQIERGPDSTRFRSRVAAIWSTWAEVEKTVPATTESR